MNFDQISLINVVMELRKLCCHPYMLEGVEPDIEDSSESNKYLTLEICACVCVRAHMDVPMYACSY